MPHQVKKQGDDYQKSKWREQVVDVVPGDITTVYFDDTKPNHSSITNNSDQILYVHTSPSVSASNHLLMVSPGSTKVLARPLGYYQIYLSAAVSEASKVRVASWEEKFTVNSVTQSMDMVQLGQMTGTVDISKMPPLSPGSNKIGSVDVTNPVTLGSSVIPPTEPIPTREAGMNDFRVGGLIVGLTSVAAKSGSSPLPNRRELTIYPPATGTVYWGKQGVKPSTGAPLTSNDSPITFKLHSQSPTIHLVSDNEVNVTVVEVS